jgi:hypothetical protein
MALTRLAAGERWIVRTVEFARRSFDLVAEAYFDVWIKSKKSPKVFGQWLNEIKRQESIYVRELWIPQPDYFIPEWLPKDSPRPFPIPDDYNEAFLRNWYEKECKPAVEQVLNLSVTKWMSRASIRDAD